MCSASFYLKDGHSEVRQLTNGSEVVTDRYEYDAYGNVVYSTGSTQNVYQYQGEQTDPNLGMQYLRARYYNQSLGRLTSVDPYEGDQAIPMTRHRYTYANNSPITFHDPSGMVAGVAGLGDISVIGAIQGALAAIRLPGMISAGAIVAGAFISGFKNRLRAGGVRWEGSIASASFPAIPSIKIATLDSDPSPEVVKGAWVIVPPSVLGIPSFPSFGFSYGLSVTNVEVFAKPQGPGAAPSVWDLAGPYIRPSFSFNLPNIPSAKLEDPGFFMGWGWGHEIGGSTSIKTEFKIGIDQGISFPITPLTNRLRGGAPPELPM